MIGEGNQLWVHGGTLLELSDSNRLCCAWEDILNVGYLWVQRYTFDCHSNGWEEQPVTLRLNREPFGEGGMRCSS